MEEVYIIDGEEISLSEVQEAAAASEMKIEDYISGVGAQLKTEEVVEKKEEVVVEDAAPAATEENAAMELPLVDGSSDLPARKQVIPTSDEKQPFNPNKGEFYYSTLPEYSEEKIAYKEWKYNQANPEEQAPVNNNPTGLLIQDVKADTKANIDIEKTYGNEESESFNKAYIDDYVSDDPDTYAIIQEKEKRDKKK
jgi:hypothetical protein